jgi:4a-hydroxytetrahydrobiopterin dehydratase
MSELAQKKCVPCEKGQTPMGKEQAKEMLKQLPGWTVSGDARWLSKEFKFPDFKTGMNFANKIAEVAESEGHHPDLQIFWGRVVAELTTHAIDGLSENDFILAAKIDALQA